MKLLRNLLQPFSQDLLFGILALLLLTVPLSFSVFTYEKFETIKMALWLALVGWATAVFFISRRNFKTQKIFFWVLVFFVAWAAVATLASVDKLNSLLGFYPRFTNGLIFYALWGVYSLLLLSGLTKERFIFLLKIVAFDALVVSLVGIIQSLGVGFYEGLDTHAFLRAPSLLGNPDFSTMFVVCVLPFVLVLFLKAQKFSGKLYYAVCGFAMLCCLLLLASRGAWLALAAALVVVILLFAALRFEKKYVLSALALLLVSGGLWYGFLQVTRPGSYSSIVSLSDVNVSSRLEVWDIAREGLTHRPVVGVGPGNFQILFQQLRGKNLSFIDGIYDDPHNLFLLLAATGGVPLVAGFLALLAVALSFAYKTARKADAVAVACIGSIVAFAAAASFTPVSTACFLVLAIAVVGCLVGYVREYAWVLPRPVLLGGTVMGIVFCAAAGIFVASECLFAAGYNAYLENNYTKSYRLVNFAITLNPTNYFYYVYRAGDQAVAGNIQQAESDIKKFTSMHPNDSKVYVSAANVHYIMFLVSRQKQPLEAAAADMRNAVSRDMFFAGRYNVLGWFYLLLGQDQLALETVKTGTSLNPAPVSSWMLLAKIYQAQNRPAQTVYALNEAFKRAPDIAVLKTILAQARQTSDIGKIFIPAGFIPTNLE